MDLGVDQRLAAGDRDHRRPALLDRRDRLIDGHAAAQLVLGVLDLAAAGARQVALEQRLKLDDQRELLAFGQPLAHQVHAHARALFEAGSHLAFTLVARREVMKGPCNLAQRQRRPQRPSGRLYAQELVRRAVEHHSHDAERTTDRAAPQPH